MYYIKPALPMYYGAEVKGKKQKKTLMSLKAKCPQLLIVT